MRWIVSISCVAGALLFIAASMLMNWSFWSGQGTDEKSGQTLGAVSIGVDIFKDTLPLIIGWALRERHRFGALVGIVFMSGCLVFSFASAIGFAATSRGTVTASHEASASHLASLKSEEQNLQARAAKLNAPRPASLIEEAITKAKQDRRWDSSKQCSDPTVEPSRVFCRDIGDLRIELAASAEADRIATRLKAVQIECNQLTIAGAGQDKDIQAGFFARITGQGIDSIQNALGLLLALMVEFGAAFGLFLALLPFQQRGDRDARKSPTTLLPLRQAHGSTIKRLPGPTKFVRTADGRLMIE